jgi:hypothetical protein
MAENHPLAPTEWGNHCWRFLHASSFTYPDEPTPEKQNAAKQFYANLGEMLPCPKCRNHYNYHIKHRPPRVESRDSLSRWLVDIHNEVNSSQDKPTVDYEIVRRHYENNSGELACETAYVKYLQQKLDKKDLTLNMLCVCLAILAIVMVALKRRR